MPWGWSKKEKEIARNIRANLGFLERMGGKGKAGSEP